MDRARRLLAQRQDDGAVSGALKSKCVIKFFSKHVCSWFLLIDPDAPPPFAAQQEIEQMRSFDLGLLALHGVFDPVARTGSYVALSGLPPVAEAAAVEAMTIVTPVLHALNLSSLTAEEPKRVVPTLSPRQGDIMRLAAAGRDDKSIAESLGLSEHTVGNHLRAVYRRLGVNRRRDLAALIDAGGAR